MDESKWSKKSCPMKEANILSKTFFCWMIPLFMKGSKKDLGTEDLFVTRNSDGTEKLTNDLEKEWDKELEKAKKGKKPSLAKAAVRTFGFVYSLWGLFGLFGECITRIAQPIFLGWVVRHFTKDPNCVPRAESLSYFDSRVYCIPEAYEAYLAAAGVCVASALYTLCYHPYFYGMQVIGMRLRVACSGLVYKKALRLSRGSMGKTTVGQMVNLLSNDVNKFDESLIFLPFLVIGPLQTAVTLIVLWQHLGWASVAGLSILILYIPFQGVMAKLFSKLRMKATGLTDERIRLMNETVAGMRVIKMYTWEQPFIDLIADSRKREVNKIRRTAILRGLNNALFFVSQKVIVLLAFLTYTLLATGNILTPEIAFVSMALYNNLRLSMTLFFPYGVSQGAEALISLRRLQRFLMLEEQDDKGMNSTNIRPKPNQCGVWLEKITGKWNEELPEPTLDNITASVKPGELLAVVGAVGSGKSSFLMAVLGELPIHSGEVKVRGKIAYASQEPWAFNGSVRTNVLFGNDYEEQKYNEVLHVCALDRDIKQLPYGDKTLVGERGVSLSGGQKARVNLARALYLDADVFLLDDPLSAVDAAVAKHLFEKCIMGYLKDKTRILVTHQLQFLKAATNILILKEGRALAFGSFNQLANSGIDLVAFIEKSEEEKKARRRTSSTMSEDVRSVTSGGLYESIVSLNSVGSEFMALSGDDPKQLEEGQEKGSVSSKIYWKYVRAGAGMVLLTCLIIGNILTQGLNNGIDYFVQIWTDEMQKNQSSSCVQTSTTNIVSDNTSTTSFTSTVTSSPNGEDVSVFPRTTACPSVQSFDPWFYVYIYAGLTGGLLLFSLIRSIIFFVICMNSSVNLHNTMFSCVIRAPINFFDNNPLGRILNRFTKDMGTIDDMIPITALDMTAILLGLMGTLVIISIVNWFMIIPSLILLVAFLYVRKYYLYTARDIKRLEGITRSPVFSHISTSLYGLTTIRAFQAQRMFETQFFYHQDHHTRSWFMVVCTSRWLGIILDWLCVLYISLISAVVLVLDEFGAESLTGGRLTGGSIGLLISSGLMLCGSVQFGVRQSTELENQMTAVERVVEYSQLKPEAALEAPPDKKPPPDWPQKGDIVFDNMSLIYVPSDPPVLKNLCCRFKSMEKIGIVGRTGAGKSSMISALFRMSEPEGIISIDGIATKDVGLHDLRGKISIIPQDPVLFTGPVRRNIDPFGKFNDSALWGVLEEVQLKEVVKQLPGGLDTFLSEGGSNFSVGQRQLICMARAILRNNKILVLDEATANVDAKTDSLIQRTIREKFRTCTVLTIAHRLNTIMDSDRVLVLDAGRIQEYDEPYILLQNELGSFYDMVEKTGPAMASQLKEVARRAAETRKQGEKLKRTEFSNQSIKRHESLKNALINKPDTKTNLDEAVVAVPKQFAEELELEDFTERL